MEVSALRYSGGIGLHARSPLLRLQSDERLVTLIRRGSTAAFEVLVARYHARLLAFCRHLLSSREDAEDVLQEVFSAAFNAILDDDRPINVRPWLYRIARNRSLNHLRRIQAVGVDSMDIHLSEHGATTADKVHEREEFRMLVGDIQGLPETQRTALVLREMDALSYEQIAEAMETTVPSVKSLLVRARVSLAEAAEARLLTCEQVRIELAEVAEGLQRRPGALVRRHLRTCKRCDTFKGQLNETSKALTAVLPVGGFVLLRKLAILHIGHSAGAGSSASGASAAGQAAAVGGTAAAGAGAVMGSTTTGFLSASIGAIATKAAAGLAAAALVTAGAVEVEQPARSHVHHHSASEVTRVASVPTPPVTVATPQPAATPSGGAALGAIPHHNAVDHAHKAKANATTAHKPAAKTVTKHATDTTKAGTKTKTTPVVPPGRTQTQTDSTVLSGSTTATTTPTTGTTPCPATSSDSTTAGTAPAPTTTSQSTDTTTTSPATDSPSTDTSGTTTSPATTTPGSSADAGAAPCAGDSTPTSTTATPNTTTTSTTTSSTTTTTTTTTTTSTDSAAPSAPSAGPTSTAGSALGAGGAGALAAHAARHHHISFRRDRRRPVHGG
jgi:RNA polymerase sigma factor (sigma-70 family)